MPIGYETTLQFTFYYTGITWCINWISRKPCRLIIFTFSAVQSDPKHCEIENKNGQEKLLTIYFRSEKLHVFTFKSPDKNLNYFEDQLISPLYIKTSFVFGSSWGEGRSSLWLGLFHLTASVLREHYMTFLCLEKESKNLYVILNYYRLTLHILWFYRLYRGHQMSEGVLWLADIIKFMLFFWRHVFDRELGVISCYLAGLSLSCYFKFHAHDFSTLCSFSAVQ